MTPQPFSRHDRWLHKPVTERGIKFRKGATRLGEPAYTAKEKSRERSC